MFSGPSSFSSLLPRCYRTLDASLVITRYGVPSRRARYRGKISTPVSLSLACPLVSFLPLIIFSSEYSSGSTFLFFVGNVRVIRRLRVDYVDDADTMLPGGALRNWSRG